MVASSSSSPSPSPLSSETASSVMEDGTWKGEHPHNDKHHHHHQSVNGSRQRRKGGGQHENNLGNTLPRSNSNSGGGLVKSRLKRRRWILPCCWGLLGSLLLAAALFPYVVWNHNLAASLSLPIAAMSSSSPLAADGVRSVSSSTTSPSISSSSSPSSSSSWWSGFSLFEPAPLPSWRQLLDEPLPPPAPKKKPYPKEPLTATNMSTFPRWKGPMLINETLRFLQEPNAVFTHHHEKLLFVVDHHGISISQRIYQVMQTPHHPVGARVEPLLLLFHTAFAILQRHHSAPDQPQPPQWPYLQQYVLHGPGLPFLTLQYDSCRQTAYGLAPVMTFCAPSISDHAVAYPTYELVWLAQPKHQWEAYFHKSKQAYPWHRKLDKVIWRGTLTGNGIYLVGRPEPNITMVRWRLCRHVHSLPPAQAELFNIGLVDVQVTFNETVFPHLDKVGGLKKRLDFEDYQNYKAVLDVDGNTWSSRFAKLMCMNTIILKVEPEYVDYFFPTVQAWTHFVPVHYNLSNLVEQTEWVLDPRNAPRVQAIIANANQWCRDHMTLPALATDMLDIWEWVIRKLTDTDPYWSRTWARHKALVTNQYQVRRTYFHPPPE